MDDKDEVHVAVDTVPQGNSSLGMAIANFMKSTVGAGILFYPLILARAGLIFGESLILGAGFIMTVSLYLIVRTSIHSHADFIVMARTLFGRPGEMITAICQMTDLVSGLAIYMKLIGEFSKRVLTFMNITLLSETSLVLILASVFILPLSLLKDLSKLSFVSVMGMICALYISGLVVVDYFVDLASDTLQDHTIEHMVLSPALLSAFSTAILGLVNQPCILPIIASLRNPTPARKTILIMSTQICVLLLYVVVALCGYLHFGSTLLTFPNVLSGKDTVPYLIGWILTALLLILTFPVILFPTRLTFHWFLIGGLSKCAPSFTNRIKSTYILFIFEGIMMIILTVLLALAFPKVILLLDVFIPLGSSYIALIFPAASFLKMRQEIKASRLEIIAAFLCLIVGVLVMFVGTPFAVIDLINTLKTEGLFKE